MIKEAGLIFPIHCIPLSQNPLLTENKSKLVLFFIEDPVFFGVGGTKNSSGFTKSSKFRFNKKRIVLFRSAMKSYFSELRKKGFQCYYLDYPSRNYIYNIKSRGFSVIHYIDPVDNELQTKLNTKFRKYKVKSIKYDSPLFITPENILEKYKKDGVRIHNSFYIRQRKHFKILLTNQGKPIGGKWSYDTENREKIPDSVNIPKLPKIRNSAIIEEAKRYTNKYFSGYYGSTDNFNFPTTHQEAKAWLKVFVDKRLKNFGKYQDAFVIDSEKSKKDENIGLFHSVISSSLNIGLITPIDVIQTIIKSKSKSGINMNDIEGFIRQVLGWREWCRYYYVKLSDKDINSQNFFNNKKSLGKEWYPNNKELTTGIKVLDIVIKKAWDNAYLHHIERLMLIGNLMCLMGINPKEVFRWFYLFSCDSYDWSMKFNILMASYSDGGKYTTKPYISSSAYFLRMANIKRNFDPEGFDLWDKIFRAFVKKHKKKLIKIPRMVMMIKAMKV